MKMDMKNPVHVLIVVVILMATVPAIFFAIAAAVQGIMR